MKTKKKSTLELNHFLDHPSEPMAAIDCETFEIIDCNKRFLEYFGVKATTLKGKDFYSSIHWNVSDQRREEITSTLYRNGIYIDKDSSITEHLFISKIHVDGISMALVRVSNQQSYAVFEQYRQLFKQEITGVYKVSAEGKLLLCNIAFARMFGYDKVEDLIGISTKQLYKYPEERKNFLSSLRKKKQLKNYEIQVVCKNGNTAICLENSFLEITSQGEEVISGIIIDITDRRNAEKALVESEQWFSTLSDISTEGVLFERDDIIRVCNNQFAKMIGVRTSEDAIGKNITEFISPAEMQKIRSTIHISPSNKMEVRLFNESKPLFVEVSGNYLSFRGEPTLALVLTDITERKKIELALERAVLRFRNLLENLPNGVIILTEQQIKFLNHAAFQLLGVEEEDDVYDELFTDYVDEEYRHSIENDLNDVRHGLEVNYKEIKLITQNGVRTDVGIKMVLSVYENRPSIQITLSDLSDRNLLLTEQMRIRLAEELNEILKKEIEQHKATQKKLEKQQRESSEQRAKLEAIFNSTENLMMWTVDSKGMITTFNRNFKYWVLEYLGKNVSIGDNIFNIIGEHLDPDLYQGQLEVMKKAFIGKPEQMELPILDKRNEKIWLLLFLNPIYIDKVFTEFSCLAYDNTERKEYEKSIRHSLKEKDVLLKEIHHRVKNNLQIISSMLNLQSSYVTGSGTKEILKDSQQRIASMSLIHETIYRNSDFSAINFSDYIQSIASNLVQSYSNPQTHVELITELSAVSINLDQSIPCGLIVNELVSNAMKYAFVGRKKGKLTIKITLHPESKVELTIKDDGVGLPDSWDITQSNSLGLSLVQALTEQLDGTLTTHVNKGTSHTLSFIRK